LLRPWVLAALLLPALSRSKETARIVACKNNLRQLGFATTMYADDTGFYPALDHRDITIHQFITYGWQAQLLPYVSGNTAVFKCPSTPTELAWPTNRSSQGFTFPYNIGNDTPFSYGYNGWGVAAVGGLGLGIESSTSTPVHGVTKPADMIAIGDSSGDGGSDGEIAFHRFWTIPVAPPGTRHRDGANIVLVDGHVEWQKQTNWIALTEFAARRWNNDNQPHRNRWISGR